MILAAILIAALGVYAYWKFIYLPSTPQFALDRFFEAANSRDYDRVYELVEVKGPLKTFVGSASALRTMAERFPGVVPQVDDHRYGDTVVNGDRAKIHTIVTIRGRGAGNTDTLDMELSRTNGIWRIDGDWVFREIIRRRAGGILLNGQ